MMKTLDQLEPRIPTQLPAGANIVGSVQNDATNSHVNAWSNFQY
jgi:hypothetical protein